MGSFCRFLPFIATNGRRNPASERSKVAIVQVMSNLLSNPNHDVNKDSLMASIPLLLKDELECLDAFTQFDSFGVCPVKRALTAVAQEVRELLQQSHSLQTDSINQAKTIMIRAIESEYKQVIAIEPLTARELEVLQLIVDGHNNSMIAEKFYITQGTVKTLVRNILKKLCVNDPCGICEDTVLAVKLGRS